MKQSIFVRVESWDGHDIYMNTPSFQISREDRERFVERIQHEIELLMAKTGESHPTLTEAEELYDKINRQKRRRA